MTPTRPAFNAEHWRREFARAEQAHHRAEVFADRLLERITDDLHPVERQLMRDRIAAARQEAWAWAKYGDDCAAFAESAEERHRRYDDLTLSNLDRRDGLGTRRSA